MAGFIAATGLPPVEGDRDAAGESAIEASTELDARSRLADEPICPGSQNQGEAAHASRSR
jgi:hypothetical protein